MQQLSSSFSIRFGLNFRPKTDAAFFGTLPNNTIKASKSTTTDKQNICSVNL